MAYVRKQRDRQTVVKKYANRRLYDTGRSSYVTLEDLCEMVKEGHDFVVVDAKTGDDLTRQVLTQIIVEQEAKEHQPMLPINFLKQLISLYGDNMQAVVPNYLEQAFDTFKKNQDTFRDQINDQINKSFSMPLHAFEEMNKQNMTIFENALKAITPFQARMAGVGGGAAGGSGAKKPQTREEAVRFIRQQIAEYQRELDRLMRI